MNILVTGGAGYIGSVLVARLLKSGHSVRVLDNLIHGGESLLGSWTHHGFSFIRGDISDQDAIRDALAKMDAVVHLAAIVGDPACARTPELAIQVNRDASVMLIEEAERARVQRLVFASTCSNYGRMPDSNLYVDEESQLAPISLYAKTKVEVEQFMLERPADGMCLTPLRLATVYGVSPRFRLDLTVNEFTMEMLATGRLVVFGEQFWRPYVHVADVGRAIALVLDSPTEKVNRRVYNVGETEENYTKAQLVELIRKHAPDAIVEFVHKEEDPRDYRVSFKRIQNELGFRVTRTVPFGVSEVARLVSSGIIANPKDLRYRN